MAIDQNPDELNHEPIEGGLAALRRLAALDKAGAGASDQDRSSSAADAAEAIPDWLELLLVKYGEEVPTLVGIGPRLGKGMAGSQAPSEKPSPVASLLEQMAAEAAVRPSPERPATSVDWGEAARPEDKVESQAPDWLERMAGPSVPPPVPPTAEEVPDWLSELGAAVPEAKAPTQPSESAEYSPGEEQVPDWLTELGITEPGAKPPETQETPSVPADQVPDWLSTLGVAASQPPETLSPTGVSGAEGEGEEIPEWLQELEADVGALKPSPPTETGLEEPSGQEEEVPDWLRELEAAEPTAFVEPPPLEAPPISPPKAAIETPAEAEGEIPDWLRDLETAEPTPAVAAAPLESPPAPPPEAAAEAPPEPEEEIPDWLRELEARGAPTREPSTPELAAETPGGPETGVPDWLADLRGEKPSPLEVISEEEISASDYPPAEEAEEPDWLAALRASGKPDLLTLEEEVVEAEEETLPDWLAELRASQAAARMPQPGLEVVEEAPERVEAEEEGIAVEYYPPLEVEAEIPEVAEAKLPPIEIEYPVGEEVGALDWLAEIEATAVLPEYAEGEIAAVEQVPPVLGEIPESRKETVETHRLPDWMVGLGEEEAFELPPPEEVPAVEEAPSVVESAVPAEIPDWLLRYRPEEVEPAPEEALETAGVLAGIPGLLPIAEEEPEVEEEPIAALRARMGVPAVPDVEGARLFKQIVTEAPTETLEGEKKVELEATKPSRGRIVETLAWALIFIVLIIAIALALMAVLNRIGDVLGGPAFNEFFGSPLVIDPAPVNTFRAQITKLPEDALVVVAFDYSPATEAEMGPLAQIILRDLLDNQARVIAVSLRPEGALMAQGLFENLGNEYPYRERTINLGYLPGQAAGVRSLAFLSSAPIFQDWTHTLEDYPAWQDVDSLADVALVVTIADSPLVVRWWVEQIGPGTRANRRLVAAVSAAADPSVRPYYDQLDPSAGQVLALLSGIRDAAAYENRLGQPGQAVESLAAQSVAHLGVVVLSLGGTVAGFRTHTARG